MGRFGPGSISVAGGAGSPAGRSEAFQARLDRLRSRLDGEGPPLGASTDERLRAQAARSYERRKREAEAYGVSTEERSPGLLSELLGPLDALRNAAAGAVSGLAGVDYEGDEVSVGDPIAALRRAGIGLQTFGAADALLPGKGRRQYGIGDLPGLKVDEDDGFMARGAKKLAAFAGDTAIDPLTYVSLGTAALGRRGAAEAVEAVTRNRLLTGATSASDDVLESFARRSLPGEAVSSTKGLEGADELAERVMDGLSPRDLGINGLSGEAADIYLEGGSRGLNAWMRKTFGDEAGEELFRALPRDVQGGVRVRVPFKRQRIDILDDNGNIAGAMKVPVSYRLSGQDSILERLGMGDTSDRILAWRNRTGGAARITGGKVMNSVRDRLRTSKLGSVIADNFSGIDGALYGRVLADMSDRMREDPSRVTFAHYAAMKRNRTTARYLNRDLQNSTVQTVRAMAVAAEAATGDDPEAAYRAATRYFNLGPDALDELTEAFDPMTGEWDLDLLRRLDVDDVLGPDVSEEELAGLSIALMGHGFVNQMLRRAYTEAGVDIPELDDYIAHIWTAEERTARDLAEPNVASRPGGTPGAGTGGYDPRDRYEAYVDAWIVRGADGTPRLNYRRLSPAEANEKAGREVFRTDPREVVVQYGEAVRKLTARVVFANELVRSGVVVRGTDEWLSFIKPRTMAEAGEELSEQLEAFQGILERELLDQEMSVRQHQELAEQARQAVRDARERSETADEDLATALAGRPDAGPQSLPEGLWIAYRALQDIAPDYDHVLRNMERAAAQKAARVQQERLATFSERALVASTVETDPRLRPDEGGPMYGPLVPDVSDKPYGPFPTEGPRPADQPAWEGGPTLYHGTGNFIPRPDELNPIDAAGQPNLYGPGLYTTASRDMGASYMAKGTPFQSRNPFAQLYDEGPETADEARRAWETSRRTYQVHWEGDEPPKVLDLESPADPRFLEAVQQLPEAGETVRRVANPQPKPDMWDLPEASREPKPPTYQDLYDALRRDVAIGATGGIAPTRSHPSGVKWVEASHSLNALLRDELGYDAFRHTGGQIMGRGEYEHDVYIWLRPEKVRVSNVAPIGPQRWEGDTLFGPYADEGGPYLGPRADEGAPIYGPQPDEGAPIYGPQPDEGRPFVPREELDAVVQQVNIDFLNGPLGSRIIRGIEQGTEAERIAGNRMGHNADDTFKFVRDSNLGRLLETGEARVYRDPGLPPADEDIAKAERFGMGMAFLTGHDSGKLANAGVHDYFQRLVAARPDVFEAVEDGDYVTYRRKDMLGGPDVEVLGVEPDTPRLPDAIDLDEQGVLHGGWRPRDFMDTVGPDLYRRLEAELGEDTGWFDAVDSHLEGIGDEFNDLTLGQLADRVELRDRLLDAIRRGPDWSMSEVPPTQQAPIQEALDEFADELDSTLMRMPRVAGDGDIPEATPESQIATGHAQGMVDELSARQAGTTPEAVQAEADQGTRALEDFANAGAPPRDLETIANDLVDDLAINDQRVQGVYDGLVIDLNERRELAIPSARVNPTFRRALDRLEADGFDVVRHSDGSYTVSDPERRAAGMVGDRRGEVLTPEVQARRQAQRDIDAERKAEVEDFARTTRESANRLPAGSSRQTYRENARKALEALRDGHPVEVPNSGAKWAQRLRSDLSRLGLERTNPAAPKSALAQFAWPEPDVEARVASSLPEAVEDVVEEAVEDASAAIRPDAPHADPQHPARRRHELAIVGCSDEKLKEAAKAGVMYLGDLHKKGLAWANTHADRVLILSSKYGLVELDDLIEPYNLRPTSPGAVTPEQVAEQAARLGVTDLQDVTVVGGQDYRRLAAQAFPAATNATEGARGIGDMKQMLAQTASLDVEAPAPRPAEAPAGQTVTVDLPPAFWDDHVGRTQGYGRREVKRLSKAVRVELTPADLGNLLSDAKHYASDAELASDPLFRGVRESAKATERRVRAAMMAAGMSEDDVSAAFRAAEDEALGVPATAATPEPDAPAPKARREFMEDEPLAKPSMEAEAQRIAEGWQSRTEPWTLGSLERVRPITQRAAALAEQAGFTVEHGPHGTTITPPAKPVERQPLTNAWGMFNRPSAKRTDAETRFAPRRFPQGTPVEGVVEGDVIVTGGGQRTVPGRYVVEAVREDGLMLRDVSGATRRNNSPWNVTLDDLTDQHVLVASHDRPRTVVGEEYGDLGIPDEAEVSVPREVNVVRGKAHERFDGVTSFTDDGTAVGALPDVVGEWPAKTPKQAVPGLSVRGGEGKNIIAELPDGRRWYTDSYMAARIPTGKKPKSWQRLDEVEPGLYPGGFDQTEAPGQAPNLEKVIGEPDLDKPVEVIAELGPLAGGDDVPSLLLGSPEAMHFISGERFRDLMAVLGSDKSDLSGLELYVPKRPKGSTTGDDMRPVLAVLDGETVGVIMPLRSEANDVQRRVYARWKAAKAGQQVPPPGIPDDAPAVRPRPEEGRRLPGGGSGDYHPSLPPKRQPDLLADAPPGTRAGHIEGNYRWGGDTERVVAERVVPADEAQGEAWAAWKDWAARHGLEWQRIPARGDEPAQFGAFRAREPRPEDFRVPEVLPERREDRPLATFGEPIDSDDDLLPYAEGVTAWREGTNHAKAQGYKGKAAQEAEQWWATQALNLNNDLVAVENAIDHYTRLYTNRKGKVDHRWLRGFRNQVRDVRRRLAVVYHDDVGRLESEGILDQVRASLNEARSRLASADGTSRKDEVLLRPTRKGETFPVEELFEGVSHRVQGAVRSELRLKMSDPDVTDAKVTPEHIAFQELFTAGNVVSLARKAALATDLGIGVRRGPQKLSSALRQADLPGEVMAWRNVPDEMLDEAIYALENGTRLGRNVLDHGGPLRDPSGMGRPQDKLRELTADLLDDAERVLGELRARKAGTEPAAPVRPDAEPGAAVPLPTDDPLRIALRGEVRGSIPERRSPRGLSKDERFEHFARQREAEKRMLSRLEDPAATEEELWEEFATFWEAMTGMTRFPDRVLSDITKQRTGFPRFGPNRLDAHYLDAEGKPTYQPPGYEPPEASSAPRTDQPSAVADFAEDGSAGQGAAGAGTVPPEMPPAPPGPTGGGAPPPAEGPAWSSLLERLATPGAADTAAARQQANRQVKGRYAEDLESYARGPMAVDPEGTVTEGQAIGLGGSLQDLDPEAHDKSLLRRAGSRQRRAYREGTVRPAEQEARTAKRELAGAERTAEREAATQEAAEERMRKLTHMEAQVYASAEDLLRHITWAVNNPNDEEVLESVESLMKGLLDQHGRFVRGLEDMTGNPDPAIQAEVKRMLREARSALSRQKRRMKEVVTGRYQLNEATQALKEQGLVGSEVRLPAELDNMLAPEVIRDMIDTHYGVRTGRDADKVNDYVRTVWSASLSLWKSWVTLGRGPGYHFRNLVGGLWNNFVGGVSADAHQVASRIMQAEYEVSRDVVNGYVRSIMDKRGISEDAARKIISRELVQQDIDRALRDRLDWYVADGVTAYDARQAYNRQLVGFDSRLMEGLSTAVEGEDSAHIVDFLAGRADRRLAPWVEEADRPAWLRGMDKAANAKWIRTNGRIAQLSEDFLRMAGMVHGIRQYGLGAGRTGEVAAMIPKALQFDYQDLSPVERKWMRGSLVPFYVWSRHNVPLQFRAALREPGKINAAVRANEALAGWIGEDDDQEVVPDWMQERLGIRTTWQPDGYPVIVGSELPITDLNTFGKLPTDRRLWQQLAGNLAPLAKMPFEAALGTDFQTGAPYNPNGDLAPAYAQILPIFNTWQDSEGRTRMSPGVNRALMDLLPPLGIFERVVAPFAGLGAEHLEQRRTTSAISTLAPFAATATLTPSQEAAELNARSQRLSQMVRRQPGAAASLDRARELLDAGWPPEAVRRYLETSGAGA